MKPNKIWELLEREHKIELPLWIWLVGFSLALWGTISMLQLGNIAFALTYVQLYTFSYNWLSGEPLWVSQLIDIIILVFFAWAFLYALFGEH